MANELLFFLGAGASVPAGVPDTIRFVVDFERYCDRDEEASRTLGAVLQILNEWRRDQSPGSSAVDVELLLEALTRLDGKDSDLLLRFFEPKRFVLAGVPPKRPLIQSLKNFIKTRAIVAPSQIDYLAPLTDFIEEYRPLDIFTANYDITIEQFCEKFRQQYVDGFQDGWDPKVFEREDIDVRLYKLHGSITWYRTTTGKYTRIASKVPETEVELITGEKAETLLLYPVQKWEYAEPFLESLSLLKLRLEGARVAIVVGYSFRDEHIRRMFLDAARRNRDLIIVLVDPYALSIAEHRLNYYEPGVPSPLSDRVVTLPYGFETVLAELRTEVLRYLKAGLASVRDSRSREVRGEDANWAGCLRPLAASEHMTLLKDVSSRVGWEKVPWPERLEIVMRLLVRSLISGRPAEISTEVEQACAILNSFFVDGLDVDVEGRSIEVRFDYVSIDGGSRSVSVDELRPVLEKIETYIAKRTEMVAAVAARRLRELGNRWSRLKEYVLAFRNSRVPAERYLHMREANCPPSLVELLTKMKAGERLPHTAVSEVMRQVMSLEETVAGSMILAIRDGALGEPTASTQN